MEFQFLPENARVMPFDEPLAPGKSATSGETVRILP